MTAIKDARNRAGYKQREVSEALSIPLGTLRRWEQGVNEPDIESLIDLANLYGTSVDALLGSRFAVEYETPEKMDADERELLDLYRAASDQGRAAIIAVVRIISEIAR